MTLIYEIVSLLFILDIHNSNINLVQLLFPLVLPQPALHLFPSYPLLFKQLMLLSVFKSNQYSLLHFNAIQIVLPNFKLLTNIFKSAIPCESEFCTNAFFSIRRILVHSLRWNPVLFKRLWMGVLLKESHDLRSCDAPFKCFFKWISGQRADN